METFDGTIMEHEEDEIDDRFVIVPTQSYMASLEMIIEDLRVEIERLKTSIEELRSVKHDLFEVNNKDWSNRQQPKKKSGTTFSYGK